LAVGQKGRERICPRCHKTLWEEVDRCPDDGATLIVLSAKPGERVGEVVDGKMTILGKLGQGGMGGVFKAWQHSIGRDIAVKLLRRELSNDARIVRRFLQEALAAQKLNHPHVVTLFDFGQSDTGELYMTMELLEGHDIGELLQSGGPMKPDRAVMLMEQVCDALHHAHENGVVHRDVKPDNVFVVSGVGRAGEFVKMLDFGIAKLTHADSVENLTRTGVVCGTPAYMSPEQALGETVDRRTDVYSMGVMLYELLEGKRPFDGASAHHVMVAHVDAQVPPFKRPVPRALQAAVHRALAKKREDRQESALALRDELRDACAGAGYHGFENSEMPTRQISQMSDADRAAVPTVRSEDIVTRQEPSSTRRWGLIAGIGALVAFWAAIGYAVWWYLS